MSHPKRYNRKSDPEDTSLVREFRAVQVRFDNDLWLSDGIRYIGEAVDQTAQTSEPKWRIRRYAVISAAGQVREEYAGEGQDVRVGDHDQVWDNRAALFDAVTTFPAPSFDGLATEAKQDVQIDLLTDILAKETEIEIEAENINLNTDDVERAQIFKLIAASKWMELADYDEVTTDLVGNVLTLTYYEMGNILGIAVITFVNSDDWTLNLTRYITEDDGTPLQDDDSTNLNLD